ncbi:hypothetical protein BGZ61DRAFT_168446 [Ilyonectria robusta]|uniref:uncharacterized protein n=1 Tax=Ilyonectria robusta TaxID=1079257 RepID=UPI001E8E9779|nr:uncharacterized protein BGZ61DRAFT_168446 [Ilyonectria robusta]KAH8733957.1 hypothetical protein BGZ61DRAFT_168446 [Ilyonectria robusta]
MFVGYSTAIVYFISCRVQIFRVESFAANMLYSLGWSLVLSFGSSSHFCLAAWPFICPRGCTTTARLAGSLMYTHTLLKKPGTMCFNFVITLFCVLCLESGKKAQEAWLRVLGLFNGAQFFYLGDILGFFGVGDPAVKELSVEPSG